ncbi:hypothetical protein GS501_08675 [Saccharibacter sp. 17.LH.SD]|uniref:F0F1 ATP synthase subunit B family protein n=1 Tax=Saccharibacter sp. 17.LH.SD TaxID=2689393 RepID=UPI00136A002E|nr:hypothetical protein [Saccharibacter sp. 17.LH.SD]MXV45109.1 hypothetical protein [Saccharibacter sp. 17.LH.SD]
MRLTPRFLLSAAPLAALPGRAVAEGMPQLHFGDPLLQGQVVWGAIIFIIFYVILSRSALPRVASVLEKRQERIQGDLALARKAKQAADQAQHELLEARNDAAERARVDIQKIRDMAKADAQSQTEATATRLEAEIRQAEKEIVAARDNALSHLSEIASSTATSLTERLLGHANDEMVSNAVERARG